MSITPIKSMAFAGAALITLNGCVEQPVFDGGASSKKINHVDSEGAGHSIIEKHIIYTPDVDLKSAVVILAKKVEILERESRLKKRKKMRKKSQK